MVYLVVILSLGALISAVWVLASLSLNAARRRSSRDGDPRPKLISKATKRSALMLIVCAAFACLMHLGMTRWTWFREGVPVGLLRVDLNGPVYGRAALAELHRRAEQEHLHAEDVARITDALIENDWWRKAGTGDEAMRESAGKWLRHAMARNLILPQQIERWLAEIPPPAFSLPGRMATMNGLYVTATYGRQWQYEHDVAYDVNDLEIVAVRLNGEPVAYDLNLHADPDESLGMYATRIEKAALLAAPMPDAPEAVVEVDYVIDLEPGGYRGLGPITWRGVIAGNEQQAGG